MDRIIQPKGKKGSLKWGSYGTYLDILITCLNKFRPGRNLGRSSQIKQTQEAVELFFLTAFSFSGHWGQPIFPKMSRKRRAIGRPTSTFPFQSSPQDGYIVGF